MIILIDNGHGINTAGKCSPDGSLREYSYTRAIAKRIVQALRAEEYDAEQLVTEERDISLRERCKRVNDICRAVGSNNVLLVSLHCNAAAADGQWKTAQGWSVFVSTNASLRSKSLATALCHAAEVKGLKIRRPEPTRPYWIQNLAICRDTNCPAVLTENLFQDNKEDVSYLLSEEGMRTITALHVEGIKSYINKL